MENAVFFGVLIFGGLALFIMACLIKYIVCYLPQSKYIKMELNRACDSIEYIHWRHELSICRWSIIPGLTPDRVKLIMKRFHLGQYAKRTESDGLISSLISSVIGICVCTICLVGGTFAWFTTSQTMPSATIQAANYSVKVSIANVENAEILQDNGGIYTLAKGEYKITITAQGTSSTGYCIFRFGDAEPFNNVHTSPIIPNKGEVVLTLVINKESETLQIIPQWGSSSVDSSTWIIPDKEYTRNSEIIETLE